MALLVFPDNPTDGQIYPINPPANTTIYQWDSVAQTWRIIGLSSGATAGTYGTNLDIPQITIDATGRATTVNNIPIASATTTSAGIVSLVDDTATNDNTKALAASQGVNLQDQINKLNIKNNLTFAGTVDGSTGLMSAITQEGANVGFAVGAPLPNVSVANDEYFVVASLAGTFTPPGSAAVTCRPGDWLLSESSQWVFYSINPPPRGFVRLDNISGSFNGTRVSFPLTISGAPYTPSNADNILVFIDGAVQLSGFDYSLSGPNIIFQTAPPAVAVFTAVTIL